MNIQYGVFLVLLVGDVYGENRNIKSKSLSCEIPSQAASLVEDFFNTIFMEFQNTPPVCVCVQMCPEQVTYCYPTSCFRTLDVAKMEENKEQPKPQQNNKQTINRGGITIPAPKNEKMESNYFGDDLGNEFAEKSFESEGRLPQQPVTPKPEFGEARKILHPDPLEHEYKNLFDLETTKSDKHFPQSAKDSKFFISMLSDKNVNAPSKYFKREIRPNDGLPEMEGEQDDGTEILIIHPENSSYTETLNSLLHSLVEDGVFPSDAMSDIIIDTEIEDSDLIKKAQPNVRNGLNMIVSMNMSNGNISKEYEENYAYGYLTDVYGTIIGILAKGIEGPNNTSLKFLLNAEDIAKREEFIKNNFMKPNVSSVVRGQPVFEEDSEI